LIFWAVVSYYNYTTEPAKGYREKKKLSSAHEMVFRAH